MDDQSTSTTETVEFSRPIRLDAITEQAETLRLNARTGECAALARRFGLLGIDRLTAELAVRRTFLGEVEVIGTLSASVVQECVVTLEPVRSQVRDTVSARFQPGGRATAADLVLSLDEEPAEPLAGDTLDLGELVAQHLALAIDPYPRADGAAIVVEEQPGTRDNAAGQGGPFAALAALKRRQDGTT